MEMMEFELDEVQVCWKYYHRYQCEMYYSTQESVKKHEEKRGEVKG